jgi:hypothetical protein
MQNAVPISASGADEVARQVLGTFNGVSDASATSPISPQDVATAAATNPVPGATRALRQSLLVAR